MSVRESMLKLAIRWYGFEDWPGEADRVTGFIDTLIAEGFVVVASHEGEVFSQGMGLMHDE